MSYDISLVDAVTNEPLHLEFTHQIKGGTYQIGGSDRASLNITYNYSTFYYAVFGDEGIRPTSP